MKLSSWPEIGSDGDVLLTPYVPKGITGHDDDDDDMKHVVLYCEPDCHVVHSFVLKEITDD